MDIVEPPREDEPTLAELLYPCLQLEGRLVLLPRGHPDACVFKSAPSTAPAVLELRSHPGMALGLIVQEEVDYSDWLVYKLGVVPLSKAIAFSFDGTFLAAQHCGQDCVLDIDMWRYEELNHIWLLRALVETRTGRIAKKADGTWSGRTFDLNEDGSCSPKNAPHLVLGGYRRVNEASKLTWELAFTNNTFLGQKSHLVKEPDRLVLIARGHPDACVFDSAPSSAGARSRVLELRSHPGKSLGLVDQHRAVIHDTFLMYPIGLVPMSNALALSFDGTFVSGTIDDKEHVLDIKHGASLDTQTVNLFRCIGNGKKMTREARDSSNDTWSGRAFDFNDDGTCSPKNAPWLVLGRFSAPKHPADIRQLNLNGARFDDDQLRLLERLLREATSLVSLRVGNNELDDAGVGIISRALETSQALLQVLDLNDNRISDDGLAPILERWALGELPLSQFFCMGNMCACSASNQPDRANPNSWAIHTCTTDTSD